MILKEYVRLASLLLEERPDLANNEVIHELADTMEKAILLAGCATEPLYDLLLPCPYCEGQSIVISVLSHDTSKISCSCCASREPIYYGKLCQYKKRSEAIAAWNTRPQRK